MCPNGLYTFDLDSLRRFVAGYGVKGQCLAVMEGVFIELPAGVKLYEKVTGLGRPMLAVSLYLN